MGGAPDSRRGAWQLIVTPTIREFVVSDLPAAAAIWQAAEGMRVPTPDEVERKLERDPRLFLVAEDEGQIVGVVMGAYDGRRGWIYRLAVSPDRRRTGIGRALVAALEDRFEAMGVAHIRLLAYGSNHAGRAFWKRLGYHAATDIVLYSKDT